MLYPHAMSVILYRTSYAKYKPRTLRIWCLQSHSF
jgi:hypothetical protein